MKSALPARAVACLLIFSAGIATGLMAQNRSGAHDVPQRSEQKRTDLTGAPGMEVIASIVEFKPGEQVEAHIHHGVEAAYVLQGTMVQVPDKPAMQLATGSTNLNLRDIKHGGFKVVGDTPLKLFTVHVVDKNQPLYDQGK